jgi:predicted secreted Zn-dependent protease
MLTRWTLDDGRVAIDTQNVPRPPSEFLLALVLLACGGTQPPPVTTIDPAAPPAILATPAAQAAILLAATRPALPFSVTVTDDTSRYEINGATAAEIGRQLNSSHAATGNTDYVGMTAPRVRWQIRIRHAGEHCDVVGATVQVYVRTVLPTWKRPVGASDALSRQWEVFMQATSRHENGHRNIALNTAAAIARTLEGDRGLPCEGLEALADASARAQWDLGNQHQLIYDEATENGATQGSRWPPLPT